MKAWLQAMITATMLVVASCGNVAEGQGGEWTESRVSHPDGVILSQGEAALHRYDVSALDAASAGGMARMADAGLRDRVDMALSIIAVDFPEFQRDFRDGGLTGVIGIGETENGTRHFAAAFAGKKGSAGETFSIFLAPEDVFDRLGGAGMLVEGPATAVKPAPAPAPARPTLASGGYPPPAAGGNPYTGWKQEGDWWRQRAGDMRSPRYARLTYAPGEADSPAAALRIAERQLGLDIRGGRGFEPLEAWKAWDGGDVRILLTHTRLGGSDGVAFVLYYQKPGQPLSLAITEMTRETFVEWGGVARMMVFRDVIPSVDVFPPDERRRIATSSLASQVKLYEAGLNKVFENGIAGLAAMTQAGVTMRMMELNYDLLLGGDITSPMIAD